MAGAVPAASPGGVTVGETKLWSQANVRPIFFCALAVIGAILYGYDGTYFTGILEMDRFKRDFGVINPDNGQYEIPSNDQSLYASIVQAGEVVGSLLAAPLGDYVGRRGGFFGACTLVALGVVLQLVTVGSKALLTLGRGVLGAGVGVISNCTPPLPLRNCSHCHPRCHRLVLAAHARHWPSHRRLHRSGNQGH